MNFRLRSVVFLATGFNVGKIPLAPGTLGSMEGLTLCYLLSRIDLRIAIPASVIFIICSIWIAHVAADSIGQKDPGCIVIDEVAGMAVALLGLPFNTYTAAAGFVLFRVFDITKPFPAGYVDRRGSGGTGIVLDDVVAGIYANLTLRLLVWFGWVPAG